VFGLPYAVGAQLSTNTLIDQQVLNSIKSAVYSLMGELNQAARICKQKLFCLWISCVYLWANLWFAALSRNARLRQARQEHSCHPRQAPEIAAFSVGASISRMGLKALRRAWMKFLSAQ